MGYAIAILAVSSIPRLHPPGSWTGSDKVAHLVEYGILGFLLRRAVSRPGAIGWLISVLIAGLIGGLDERYQSLVEGRVASLFDWIADLCGASIGAFLWPVVSRRKRRRTRVDGEEST